MEITIGKLNTAIRMLLLLALAAMLERRVREVANPMEVRRINTAKTNLS